MNSPDTWKQMGAGMPPDIYASRAGVLTLRLPHVPEKYPYTYQWGGVIRPLSADLGKYPVLVANVASVTAGSYAHLMITESDYAGHQVHQWRSATLEERGLIVFDLGKELGPSVRRLTLQLIVGGKLDGAKVEYNWVRFIRQEDVSRLQKNPDLENVTSREPVRDIAWPPPAAGTATPGRQNAAPDDALNP